MRPSPSPSRINGVCSSGQPRPGTRWRSRHLAAGEHRHYCVNCVKPQSAVYGVIWSYGGAGIGVDRLFAPAACRVELEASCTRLADFQFQPVHGKLCLRCGQCALGWISPFRPIKILSCYKFWVSENILQLRSKPEPGKTSLRRKLVS